MRASIRKEFADSPLRAVVLDDRVATRRMIARHLRRRGFEVLEFATVGAFYNQWLPGTADVIVADWQLSNKETENGDRILEQVRERDWDVPFVLVSGQLAVDSTRLGVIGRLLESGGARFVERGSVERGSSAIRKVGEEAEALIERRDLALLKVILSLRPGALSGATIQTSSGSRSAAKLLEDVVSRPEASHDAERPVATSLARRSPRRKP